MYLKHFKLQPPLFSEFPDLKNFFSEFRREQVCQSLILDILAGKSLLKLVGKEGTGKTLICRVIEERLPESCRVVLLENPVGSFEELLRLVCADLGMEPKSTHDQMDMYAELQRLLAREKARGLRVVLLVDEAEKLFLAVLERLVHHVGEGGGDLQLTLVLVGRPGLDANLEQIASFSPTAAFSGAYVLEALSESETRQYLRFRAGAAGMSREQFAEVFTEGVV
ncbi:MAG: ExeA family protein, partial [Porticoccaceae bacterium]